MIRLLRNFFKSVAKNTKMLILSVFISVIIWIAISLEIFPDVDGTIENIPVQVSISEHMRDENLHFAENYDNLSVSIQIQGKRYDIGRLTSNDFEASLDLSEIINSGSTDVPIVVKEKDGVKCEITQQSLQSVRINIERFANKTLEIEAVAEGIAVIEGLQIDTTNLKANPSSITITGEEKLVNSISRAEVTVNYDGTLLNSTELKGELSLYNNNNVKVENPDLALDNSYFTITVPLHKMKELPLTFNIINYPPNFDIAFLQNKISITPSVLNISSPDSSIDSLNELSISNMSLSDLTYQFINSPKLFLVDQFLVDGYRNISNQPYCTLEFKDIDDFTSLQFNVPSENFNIINQPSIFDANFLTKEVVVNVVGPSWYVQALSIDDISLTVNLLGSDISEGAKTLTATCRINGESVKAWVSGVPKIEILFTNKTTDE